MSAAKPHRPVEGEYKKVGPGRWQKWNPILMVLSTLEAEYNTSGEIVRWHTRIQQPRAVQQAILDHNVDRQNSWKGRYGGDLITQTTSLPIAIHQQVMEQCGFQKGHGYDEKKFAQIMNDRDNYKLKCVPGRI